MKINDIVKVSSKKKLSDLCTIRTNFADADFWVVRRGTKDSVGKPTYDFNPEHIGIKVNKTDILLPKYLYYVLQYLHSKDYFKMLAHGTTRLVNIRTTDISDIRLDTEAESVKNFKYRDMDYKMNEPRMKYEIK